MDSAHTPNPRRKRPGSPVGLLRILFVFFLLGCAGLVPVARQAHRDYRVAKHYLKSEAEILEAVPIRSGYYSRPGKRRDPSVRPSFVFKFTTREGETVTTRGYDAYGGREAPPAEWHLIRPGHRVACWYNPADPAKAVLSRRFNPHFYWVLALPFSLMGFTGLLLREGMRRAVPPTLKGVAKGRRLAWRLPPVASQRAMTGCLGGLLVLCALLTVGFCLAALDYQTPVHRYRWLSYQLGFNVNGWWFVMLATLAVALVLLWAFLANLRWVAVPEPELEIEATALPPGGRTRVQIEQAGPLRAESYSVSLVCEINGTPGKPPAIRRPVLEREKVFLEGGGRLDHLRFDLELEIPANARTTCKSVPVRVNGAPTSRDLVAWFLRVERKVSAKTILQTDFEILVEDRNA